MIVVRDDLIPQKLQDHLELLVFGDELILSQLPLTCKQETTANDGVNPLPTSFGHVLKSSTKLTDYYGIFSKVPQLVLDKLEVKWVDVIQARLFITVPHKTTLAHYNPHTDLADEHLALIYYVNDSDGDTVFFENDKIVKRVSPKKGRVIVFDGSHLHAGGYPTNVPRCIVNYNIHA